MDRNDRTGIEAAPLRRAATAEEAGRLLAAGEVVEVAPELAEALGAVRDDCIDADEAFAARGDPAEFGDEGLLP